MLSQNEALLEPAGERELDVLNLSILFLTEAFLELPPARLETPPGLEQSKSVILSMHFFEFFFTSKFVLNGENYTSSYLCFQVGESKSSAIGSVCLASSVLPPVSDFLVSFSSSFIDLTNTGSSGLLCFCCREIITLAFTSFSSSACWNCVGFEVNRTYVDQSHFLVTAKVFGLISRVFLSLWFLNLSGSYFVLPNLRIVKSVEVVSFELPKSFACYALTFNKSKLA